MSTSPEIALEPFFLEGPHGRLFCLFQGPPTGVQSRGGVLLVPPFAEELNKSRRQFFLQGRALAEAGYATLLADLSGTGDSEGEFGAARWGRWVEDLEFAARWLRARVGARLALLAVRFGALLAAELARRLPDPPERLVLWQPVASGKQHLDQFLRLRVAAAMLGGGNGESVRGLRDQLASGAAIEVAGYELQQEAVQAIDSVELAKLTPPAGVAVDWLELVHSADTAIGPGSERVAASWRERSVNVRSTAIVGEPFWSTVEIAVVPALIEHTTRLLTANG